MKRILVCLVGSFLLNLAATGDVHSDDSKKGWSQYKGAWFDIQYPSSFIVKPSIKSTTSKEGYDSVSFASMDGSVEFYVFSPQWNGDPVDIELKPGIEEYASRKDEKKNGKVTGFFTIRALDKSYLRSYVDTEDTRLNTRLVFGIKYRSQKDYDRYKQYYLKFKQSLRQYAD
jgi:hypothetical protein